MARFVVVTSLISVAAALPAASRRASPPLNSLLSRATDYVSKYLPALSSVVCEERYLQHLERQDVSHVGTAFPRVDTGVVNRTLDSDYLLVQLPGGRGWLPFRDVYAVDGDPVRDRSDRLMKLFAEPHTDRLRQADRIRIESSRYNIGADRDTNLPTFALQFLLPEVRGHFAFRLKGSETVEGTEVQVIEYDETTRPSLITSGSGDDVPAKGQFWIEEPSGFIVKTRLDTQLGEQKRRIDVTYRQDATLGMAVPGSMDERYSAPGETLTARATYSNFRRFQVSTSEEVK